MAQRILITGAQGNVGREVVRACHARALSTRSCVRHSGAESTPDNDMYLFDFRDRTTWEGALSGCEQVLLLRPPPMADVEDTLNPFIDAAYAAGVQHIVFLSVLGAESKSWVPHRKVELHLMQSQRSWTILRPGFFAQNFEGAYRQDILADGRVYVPAGDGHVAFLDVLDVGDIAAAIFSRPDSYFQKALPLTGPRAVTFTEATKTLSGVIGREISYAPANVLAYGLHLRFRRKAPWMQALIQAILHRGLRTGEAETVASTTQEVLGRPATSLESYFERNRQLWIL